jgi:rubredoxin
MIEKKGHKEGNEARIKDTIAPLTKYEHTGGYSCKACGNPFNAGPPDDVHRLSSVYQCWKFDWIERSYRCPECSNTTTLYWHPRVHKHQDYTSREEINRKFSKDNNSENNNNNNNNNARADYLQRMTGY